MFDVLHASHRVALHIIAVLSTTYFWTTLPFYSLNCILVLDWSVLLARFLPQGLICLFVNFHEFFSCIGLWLYELVGAPWVSTFLLREPRDCTSTVSPRGTLHVL